MDLLHWRETFGIISIVASADYHGMSDQERKRGKRKVEEGYNISRSFRFQAEDVERLDLLAKEWRCSTAAVLRRLLAEAVEQRDEKKGN